MRTTIFIDDKLMAAALRATGLRTKREVVELGLKTLLRLQHQAKLEKPRDGTARDRDVTRSGGPK